MGQSGGRAGQSQTIVLSPAKCVRERSPMHASVKPIAQSSDTVASIQVMYLTTEGSMTRLFVAPLAA